MKDLKNLSLEELKKMKLNKDKLNKNLKKNNNMNGGMVNSTLEKNIEIKLREQNPNDPLIQLWKYDPQSDVVMRPLGFVKEIGYLANFNLAPDYFHQFNQYRSGSNRRNLRNAVININVYTSSTNINMTVPNKKNERFTRIFVLAKNLYYFDIAGMDVLVIYSTEDSRPNNIKIEEIKNQFRANTGNVKRVRVTRKLNELGNENFERINEYLNK